MAHNAYAAYGTIVKVDPAGGTSWITLEDCTVYEGPGVSRETIDVTPHDSGGDGWREFIGGLRDGGELTIECNMDPRTDSGSHMHTGNLRGAFDASADTTGNTPQWQIVFGASALATWQFYGIVTNMGPSAPVDGVLGLSITVKVSSTVDFDQ